MKQPKQKSNKLLKITRRHLGEKYYYNTLPGWDSLLMLNERSQFLYFRLKSSVKSWLSPRRRVHWGLVREQEYHNEHIAAVKFYFNIKINWKVPVTRSDHVHRKLRARPPTEIPSIVRLARLYRAVYAVHYLPTYVRSDELFNCWPHTSRRRNLSRKLSLGPSPSHMPSDPGKPGSLLTPRSLLCSSPTTN